VKYTDIQALPFRYLVWIGAAPDLTATADLTAHLQRPGATIPTTWKGAEVITREEAMRRTASAEGDLYSPWTRTLMPPDEAALWTDRDLLYAAHWGCSERPAEWDGGRWGDAESLLFDAKMGFPKVARLIAAFKRQPESVQAAARERATTAENRRAGPEDRGEFRQSTARKHRTFPDFLISILSVDEARRHVRWWAPELEAQLPSPMVPPASFMSDLAALLRREGRRNDFLAYITDGGTHRRTVEIMAWCE
jgi:hypothetical protein